MLPAAVIIMGLGGIVAEILLLRELLVSFFGNELTVGVILANWLILEACGSFFIGRSVEKTKRRLEIFVLLQLIFAASLPLAIYLARIFKNIILATPGEGIGFIPVFYTSLLILLPVSICHGALFTYSCRLYAHLDDATRIGRVYALETLGSICGGLLITFILLQYLNSFQIAFLIALMNAVISLLLLWPYKPAGRRYLRNGLWLSSLLLTVLFSYLLCTPQAQRIHLSSIQAQWHGLTAIHYENSVYGNITVTKSGEQFTFYVDGIPSITSPHPDVAFIEDFVHFTLLHKDQPGAILILSGGAGGLIREILKYPVTSIDYVELDPLLLKLVRRFSTPLTEAELTDARVRIHYTDGRFFLRKTKETFDVIFIGLTAPQDLQTNRLFSKEFFLAAKERLNPEGIVALTLPGSLTYISPELRNMNGCILDTLKSVYRHVKIIPGDLNLYLASDGEKLVRLSLEEIVDRFKTRNLETSLFNSQYISYRLQERWLNWWQKGMDERRININSDFQPRGVYFGLSYWSALFSPYFIKYFKWFEDRSLSFYFTLLVGVLLFLALVFLCLPRLSIYSVPFAILSSGFADMMLVLVISFSFQVFYGYLYYQIGLLLTVFMIGVGLSSFYITRRLGGIQNPSRAFLYTELYFVLFALALPLIFLSPAYQLERTSVYIFLYVMFLLASFLCGTLVGLQFPLANKICLSFSSQGGVGHTAGLLYGADLLGGFFGGLMGGVLLLPLLGLKETCYLLVILKAGSLGLFLLFTKISR